MPFRRLQARQCSFLALAAFAGLTGCGSGDLTDARRLYTGTDSMGMRAHARVIPVHGPPDLLENSGATMSTSQPGVIFTINDSGNEPVLFALDTTGGDRGAWRVEGAINIDWEAIAGGPCGGISHSRFGMSPRGCLYIGDVGDNDAVRKSVTIYRMQEPNANSAGVRSHIAAESLQFTYEDGRHDVEAMFVAPDGSVNLITKRPLRTALGRLRPSLIFAIPAAAWGHSPAVARRVDSLGIVPASAPNRVITDASLSRDARYLAVRTYWQVFIFITDSTTGRVADSIPLMVFNVAGLHELQGEGISWYLDSDDELLLTSEGRAEPLRVIGARPPAALDSASDEFMRTVLTGARAPDRHPRGVRR